MSQSQSDAHHPELRPTYQPPRRRDRRLLFAGVAGGLALCFAVGMVELGLWIFAPLSYHEWLEMIPDGNISYRMAPFQVVDNARGNQVRINRYGFRGPDYAYTKAPGTLRIEVFGGSSAFEYFSSSDEKTWPGALEKKLRERLKMPVEVINLALPGLDNFAGKINYLCNGRAFKPDVIIQYEAFNDMGQRRFRTLETVPFIPMGAGGNRPMWMQLARKTQIGRRGRVLYFTMTKRSMEGAYVLTDEKKEPGLARPVHPSAFAWYRRNLEDFALLSASDGVLCVLCSQSYLGTKENITRPEIREALAYSPDRCGMTLELIVDTYEKMSAIGAEVAEKYNCVFFDGYRAVPHDLEHIRDNVHFFDKGSEVLAEALAQRLLNDARFMKVVERVRSEKAGRPVS